VLSVGRLGLTLDLGAGVVEDLGMGVVDDLDLVVVDDLSLDAVEELGTGVVRDDCRDIAEESCTGALGYLLIVPPNTPLDRFVALLVDFGPGPSIPRDPVAF
jgi:hypothetical protein